MFGVNAQIYTKCLRPAFFHKYMSQGSSFIFGSWDGQDFF